MILRTAFWDHPVRKGIDAHVGSPTTSGEGWVFAVSGNFLLGGTVAHRVYPLLFLVLGGARFTVGVVPRPPA